MRLAHAFAKRIMRMWMLRMYGFDRISVFVQSLFWWQMWLFPTTFDFINEKRIKQIFGRKKMICVYGFWLNELKMCEKELCENEDCTKQIHYLNSSSGFKIALSKSYRFIFTYILFHFFVTFKLRIVLRDFCTYRICDKRWHLQLGFEREDKLSKCDGYWTIDHHNLTFSGWP